MIAADIDTDDISNLPQEMHNALLAAYDMDSANVDDNIMHDISGNGHVANMMNFASEMLRY